MSLIFRRVPGTWAPPLSFSSSLIGERSLEKSFLNIRLFCTLLFCLLFSLSPTAEAAPSTPPPIPAQAAQPLTVRYYGHAFIYVISSTGVRIAIDPYGDDTVKYAFPPRLPADVVLVSSETDDHDASARLFGSPQVFRSVTAIGLNNARGLFFKGIQTLRNQSQGATNAVFTFKLDGVRFCHLGNLGTVPDSSQRSEIGQTDVLFLPVGNKSLSLPDLNRIVRDFGAKIIIPIRYKTDLSGDLDLRPLDDYLAGQSHVKKLTESDLVITPSDLPPTPTVTVLPFPTPATPSPSSSSSP